MSVDQRLANIEALLASLGATARRVPAAPTPVEPVRLGKRRADFSEPISLDECPEGMLPWNVRELAMSLAFRLPA